MRIALIPQSQQDVDNMVPVAHALRDRGRVAPEFLSLDQFLRTRLTPTLRERQVPVREIPTESVLKRSFYLHNNRQKLLLVLRSQRALARAVQPYDALMVASDGALERVCLQRMLALKRPTFLLFHSLISPEPTTRLRELVRLIGVRLGLSHLFFSELGQSGCTRVFALGQHNRDILVDRGVAPASIEITGVPRMAAAVGRAQARQRSGWVATPHRPLRLLYLAQAWDWHDEPEISDMEYRQAQRLAAVVRDLAQEVAGTVRPHPRSSRREVDRLSRIAPLAASSSAEPIEVDIDRSDIVISTFSTGSIEASLHGKLVVSLDFGHRLDGGPLATMLNRNALPVLRHPDQLRDLLRALLRDGDELERQRAEQARAFSYFVTPECGAATDRIVAGVHRELGLTV